MSDQFDYRKELHAAHGHIAMLLSNIDFLVGNILEVLINPQALFGSLVVDRMPFERRIKLTRTLAKFRFANQPDVFDRFFDLMQRADSIRIVRNQFIHGFWDHAHVSKGVLRCCDPNWDLKGSLKKGAPLQPSRMESTEWTLETFNEFGLTVNQLVIDLSQLDNDLKSLTMLQAKPKNSS